MHYKVFLVEDETVTREGIRDNVDWDGFGFEFCGDAPDGEIALPSLQTLQPDVLITDIRMPFMDGLELSRIVREHMPATKIVILSGHDEFEYAQEAIKIGVCEYLLKPVSVQDLHYVLERLATSLDAEKGEEETLQKLRDQLDENRTTLRDHYLLRVVTGTASSAEAIEKFSGLGIELLARCYLVAVMRLDATHGSLQLDLGTYQRAQQLLSGIVENNPQVLLLRKDVNEWLLLIKGSSAEQLRAERDKTLARAECELSQADCRLVACSGSPQYRITDICRSFMDATDGLEAAAGPRRKLSVSEGAHRREGIDSPIEKDARRGPAADSDFQVFGQTASVVQQAQEYIQGHFMDSELSLNSVAAHVNLSASYFSAVFSRELGKTFKEFLTDTRLKRAKELLRTTSMMATEISYKVGYSDPHYFSFVFRKHTGLTPMEFRAQAGRRT